MFNSIPEQQLQKEPAEPAEHKFHFDNLLDDIKTNPSAIAAKLLDKIQEDLKSRASWEQFCKKGFEYLGLSVEELPELVKDGSKVTDNLMMKLLYEYYANIKHDILKSTGELTGLDENINAAYYPPVAEYMDFYFKNVLKQYLDEFDKVILYAGFIGTAYKEIFYCYETNKIDARPLSPFDVIIDANATSMNTAEMITISDFLSKKSIEEKIDAEYFSEIKFLENSVSDNSVSKKLDKKLGTEKAYNRLNEIYTCYAYYKNDDLFSDGDTRYFYYKFIIHKDLRKLLRIERCHFPDGKQIKSVVAYKFLPSFKFYGTGIINLVGSNSLATSAILRNSIDIARMASHPSFIIKDGYTFNKNTLKFDFGNGYPLDTGGQDVNACFTKIPIQPPSQELIGLRESIRQDDNQWLSSLPAKLSENSNAPVGTTLAIMEQANRLNSVILESFYLSFQEEIKVFYNFFRYFVQQQETFGFNNQIISGEDFIKECPVTPACGSDLSSKSQKIVMAESILNIANQNPQLHNMYYVYKKLYETLGVKDVDQFLIQPQPPQQQPVDPTAVLMQEAQTKQQQAQADIQFKQQQLNIEQQKLQAKEKQIEFDKQVKQRKLDIEAQNI